MTPHLLTLCVLLTGPSLAWAQAANPAATNPFEGDAKAAEAGEALFNETCSHCHGPNAVTSITERNLRHLRSRYGDQMAETFHTTVNSGRPELGMPAWGEVIDERTQWQIYTYLESVQN